jgi:hypothetical protein
MGRCLADERVPSGSHAIASPLNHQTNSTMNLHTMDFLSCSRGIHSQCKKFPLAQHSSNQAVRVQVSCHSMIYQMDGSVRPPKSAFHDTESGSEERIFRACRKSRSQSNTFLQYMELRRIPEDGRARPLASPLCSHRGGDLVTDHPQTWRKYGLPYHARKHTTIERAHPEIRESSRFPCS